jgi:hypothetical protein
MYKTTLAAFESARAQVKNENLRLPFSANATRIYDRYIHFLVQHGRSDEALAIADQSRARTLEQGLGVAGGNASFRPANAQSSPDCKEPGATLLFYWLGAQSVLSLGHHAGKDHADSASCATRDC